MAKIIKILNDVVSIGLDNGSIKEVRRADLSFDPIVGLEVDIFENENNIIITKKEKIITESPKTEGININVNNANNNANPTPVYIANNTKAVNKVTYCLLAFFIGGLGIHKFYAGKTGSGILFILFCWTGIPAIIAFIDFIIAICKKADENGNILI